MRDKGTDKETLPTTGSLSKSPQGWGRHWEQGTQSRSPMWVTDLDVEPRYFDRGCGYLNGKKCIFKLSSFRARYLNNKSPLAPGSWSETVSIFDACNSV